jgi:hypothetical protein
MSRSTYTITNQRELRRAFWRDNPGLSRRRITDYSGNGTMHTTDTRCAFVDYLDNLSRDGQISDALAQRATLGG